MDAPEQPVNPMRPELSVVDIDIRKVRAALSLREGSIVPETEARLCIVRAGFMPRCDDRWTPTPGSAERLREALQ